MTKKYSDFISQQQSKLIRAGLVKAINEVKYPKGSPYDIPIQPKSFYDAEFSRLRKKGINHPEAHKQTLDYIKQQFPKNGKQYADMLNRRYQYDDDLGLHD